MQITQKKQKKQMQNNPHLDYISPWKHIDTNRQIVYQLTKNKFFSQLCSQQQNRKKQIPIKTQASFYNSSQSIQQSKKETLQSDVDFEPHVDNRSRFYSSNMSYLKKQQFKNNRRHWNKSDFQLAENKVFAKKNYPSAKLHLATLGNLCQETKIKLDQSQIKKLSKLRTYTTQIFSKNPGKADPSTAESLKKKFIEENYVHPRKRYRTISSSLLKNLSMKKKQEDQTYRLNKTVTAFMKLQKQV